MKKITCLCAIAFMVVLFLGCSGSRNKKVLPTVRYPGMTGKRSLVVLLPTMGGKGSHYETEGFLDEVWERGFEASLEVVDVTPTLYLGNRIVKLLKTEHMQTESCEQRRALMFLSRMVRLALRSAKRNGNEGRSGRAAEQPTCHRRTDAQEEGRPQEHHDQDRVRGRHHDHR